MSLSTADLARFRAVIAEVGAESLVRERERRLLHPEIAALVASGFTAMRVPVEWGGAGATLPELFTLLVELGAADPNLPQALRGHFGLVERFLVGGTARDETWLRRAAAGALFANSQAEKGSATTTEARLVPVDGGGWRLTGRKFYTTGTLYADYTWTGALDPSGERYGAVVPTAAPGVEVLDDWTGFGQRLTASGTTVFADVPLDDESVYRVLQEPDWYTLDFRLLLHLLLQATMAGIGRAALEDTLRFVRGRSRSFGVAGESLPREDPRVQSVVGELASRVAAVEALVHDVARDYAAVREREHADEAERTRDYVRVQIRQFEAQQIAVADIVAVTSRLFEVGGASAVLTESGLDRHWRNARTIASHNPAVFRQAAIGAYLLNGTEPETDFRTSVPPQEQPA
ncbi:acyl-CoA dehydrogenase family protein [Rathayibacter sp. VKM Ac-2927]|uniref:acyl-CoA dehydrogenase family protein n=1 Tax=Rathayibacter sp. VKM Ac-2927 TaxID=2929478 RepID=UPI001FB485F0|nr:acyl-CoA dehydrogenase family protein [Rathayibacter sp. VKM Ac-2927]MCJ1688766.1 acyl-CoA dehydrogenase family protein [Rathayibacter sp. VKM Ac-2927]